MTRSEVIVVTLQKTELLDTLTNSEYFASPNITWFEHPSVKKCGLTNPSEQQSLSQFTFRTSSPFLWHLAPLPLFYFHSGMLHALTDKLLLNILQLHIKRRYTDDLDINLILRYPHWLISLQICRYTSLGIKVYVFDGKGLNHSCKYSPKKGCNKS